MTRTPFDKYPRPWRKGSTEKIASTLIDRDGALAVIIAARDGPMLAEELAEEILARVNEGAP